MQTTVNEIRPLAGSGEVEGWLSLRAFLASLVIPGLRDLTPRGREAMGNRRPGKISGAFSTELK